MAYKYSKVDEDNLLWFPNDSSRATLLRVKLIEGALRGLHPFEMNLKYPITAVAGRNGSGKSTILAMAACAYHNQKEGFKLPARKFPYYTFSDFFVQTNEEVSQDGIVIHYQFHYSNWRKTENMPNGIGIGWQRRSKKRGGKWTDYSTRVKRNVVFFGIERVVPHSEKSVSKSYRSLFSKSAPKGWEENVKGVVGRILNKDYSEFWYKEYTKHRLPVVTSSGTTYSGFNMGAGENALFEIFSTIFACPPGLILVIDEIELGLHEEAQIRLIKELKEICNERHIQVICTTHSFNILKCLPPEARFFVESFKTKTIITPGISPYFAAGKMAGENSCELDVFVEDGIAKHLVETALPNDLRTRINVIPIGSSASIVRQLAARYKNIKKGECLAILDGDKSPKLTEHYKLFLNALEHAEDQDKAQNWIEERLTALPGNTWPENWLLTQCQELDKDYICEIFSVNQEHFEEFIEEAFRAGKHSEFFTLSKRLNLDADYICKALCLHVANHRKELFCGIHEAINKFLD